MMRTMILLLAVTALFCSRGTSVATDNRVVARFNGEAITVAEFAPHPAHAHERSAGLAEVQA